MAQKQKSRGRPIKNKADHIPDTADNIARAIFRGADKKLLEKCAKEDYLLARTLARKQLLDDDDDLSQEVDDSLKKGTRRGKKKFSL